MGTETCDCGNDEFLFVKDLNLEKAWKTGNKFARICDDCGSRYFLSKSMYEQATDQWVILDGEDSPVPIFDCPACDETVTGQPDACPYCDAEYLWDAEEEEEVEDAEEVEADDPDPGGEDDLDEDDESDEDAADQDDDQPDSGAGEDDAADAE